MRQRYISNELTHFVGASLRSDHDRQYALLCEILRTGIVKSRPYQEHSGWYSVLAEANILGESVDGPYVCFCDIPVADLQIHSEKYGSFGLAFRKSFLVNQGANPVFYVATNSVTPPQRRYLFDFGRPSPAPKSLVNPPYEREPKRRHDFFEFWRNALHQMLYLLENERRADPIPHPYDFMTVEWFLDLREFLYLHVFGFTKYFDPLLTEDDSQNFYMEREWRLLDCVRFTLNDVVRVLLPSTYARRLRADVPEYYGQVTFIE